MKVSGDMLLRQVIERFPQLEEKLYEYIGECLRCRGFMDERLSDVFSAHGLDWERCVRELNRVLEGGHGR